MSDFKTNEKINYVLNEKVKYLSNEKYNGDSYKLLKKKVVI